MQMHLASVRGPHLKLAILMKRKGRLGNVPPYEEGLDTRQAAGNFTRKRDGRPAMVHVRGQDAKEGTDIDILLLSGGSGNGSSRGN